MRSEAAGAKSQSQGSQSWGRKKATVTHSPSHLRREFILKFKAGGLVFEVPMPFRFGWHSLPSPLNGDSG
jgi:hypothetical protein